MKPERRTLRETLFELRALLALVLLIGVFSALSPAF